VQLAAGDEHWNLGVEPREQRLQLATRSSCTKSECAVARASRRSSTSRPSATNRRLARLGRVRSSISPRGVGSQARVDGGEDARDLRHADG
jgi:hypothetical protein